MQFTTKFALLAVAVTYCAVSVTALPIYHRYDGRAVVADIPSRNLDSSLAFVARDVQSLFERGGKGSKPGPSKKLKKDHPASSKKAAEKKETAAAAKKAAEKQKNNQQPQQAATSSHESHPQQEGHYSQVNHYPPSASGHRQAVTLHSKAWRPSKYPAPVAPHAAQAETSSQGTQPPQQLQFDHFGVADYIPLRDAADRKMARAKQAPEDRSKKSAEDSSQGSRQFAFEAYNPAELFPDAHHPGSSTQQDSIEVAEWKSEDPTQKREKRVYNRKPKKS